MRNCAVNLSSLLGWAIPALVLCLAGTRALAASSQLDGIQTQLSGGDVAFYTFAFSVIVFYAATVAAIRQYRYLIFALQAALMVVLLSALDGTLRILANGDETFAFSTPLIAQGAYAGVAFIGAAVNLEPPHRFGRLRPWLLALSIPCFVIPFGLPFFSYFTLYLPMNVLVLSVIAVQALPPFTWTNLSDLQRRWATISPVIFAGSVVGVYLSHFVYFDFSQAQLDVINRALFAGFAVYSLGTVGLNLFATLQSKEAAERDVLRSQAEQAELALALAEAEQDYAAALRVAQSKTQQLAGASHDLKQPLAALRLSVSQFPVEDDRAEQMRDALNYVEDLAKTYATDNQLQEAMDESADGVGDLVPPHNDELVSIQLIFSTLEAMFASDAEAAGVTLRVRPSGLRVRVSPLTVTRVLTNLVANSLAHARPRKLLVGARGHGGQVHVYVLDDGVGIERGRFNEVMRSGVKGSDSAGQGLGLAIVADLARLHDYDFRLDSEVGKGTVARISLPRA